MQGPDSYKLDNNPEYTRMLEVLDASDLFVGPTTGAEVNHTPNDHQHEPGSDARLWYSAHPEVNRYAEPGEGYYYPLINQVVH